MLPNASTEDVARQECARSPNLEKNRAKLPHLAIVALFSLLGAGIVASTYTTFSQAIDEPAHIACGMEWWAKHTYTYEYQHPPIARVASATFLYLAGARLPDEPNMWHAGNAILNAAGRYERNLVLARLGTLPFYILAVLLTFSVALCATDSITACLSALLFGSLPKVLGIGSLAYTDMAVTAGFACFALCWAYWLNRPNWKSDVLLGCSIAFAVCSKYSAIPFIIAACAIHLLLEAIRNRTSPRLCLSRIAANSRHVLAIAPVVFLCTWAAFQFSTTTLLRKGSVHPVVDKLAGTSGRLHDATYKLLSVRVPLAEVEKGISDVAGHDEEGHKTYAFGREQVYSPWYFFPAIIVFTTPIPFLVLATVGVVGRSGSSQSGATSSAAIPIAFSLGVLIVVILSNIGIGTRHVLPIFPFLAILAAQGCVCLWRRGRSSRALAIILLVSELACCGLAYPDFLAYTNALVSDPWWLSAHDIDYGQDTKRLVEVVRGEHIAAISVALTGTDELDKMGLPMYVTLKPFTPVQGWVAVSLLRLRLDDSFQWVENYKPVRMIGKTIRLYWIPPTTAAAPPLAGTRDPFTE